jgi:hypothetical protein
LAVQAAIGAVDEGNKGGDIETCCGSHHRHGGGVCLGKGGCEADGGLPRLV